MKNSIILLFAIAQFSLSCSTTQKANHNTARSNKSTIKGDDADYGNNSLQQKANINTSRSNTKGINNPNDSLQQKANHNTARSNKSTIKGDDAGHGNDSLLQKANINTSRSNTKGINNPNDSLQQKENHNTARSNKSTIKGDDAGHGNDSLLQKANINTSRSNTKGINNPDDSLLQKANHNTARSNKSTIKDDGDILPDSLQKQGGYDYSHRLTRGTSSAIASDGGKEGLASATMKHQSIFLGGGYKAFTNSSRTKTNLSNTNEIIIGVYLPVLNKATVNYGININAEYSFSNNSVPYSLPDPFVVEGHVSSKLNQTQNNRQSQSGYAFSIGPQMNFAVGNKLLMSPIVQASFLHINQQGFSIEQTINNGREDYTFIIQSQPQTRLNIFTVKPALRFEFILNKKIGIWAEANYTTGTEIQTNILHFYPEGKANTAGEYTLSQMQNGTEKDVITKSKYKAAGFMSGISLKLSKNKDVKFKAGAELSDKVN
jgi:hypothetical protein